MALLAAAGSAAGQEVPTLPNGASSLQETYQDWIVSCAAREANIHCSLAQQQSQQDGQRVLGIELAIQEDGTIGGLLVLPFGLALEAGATFQVDDQPAQPAVPFGTCLPVGCIVRLSLAAEQITAMRNGTKLLVHVRAEGAGEVTILSLSLSGFAAALDRTQALAG